MSTIEKDPTVLSSMVDRLSHRFPGTTRDHIAETVREGYRALSDSPVRAYVPNLVEHGARTRLMRESKRATSAA